ncbi:MAG: PKD domain-containing protein [Cytophagales bacterium]|nr:PKD domain-containing protein [Cytophagales bacterium]
MVIKFYVRNLLILSFLISFIGYHNQSFAQGYFDYNWYFGNSIEGVIFNKFNNEPLVVSDQAVPFGVGGSAVATDDNTGQLLFYADGDNIYDASHNIMLNGGGILGNALGNQPVAISPIPGEPGRYYVFSNTANFNNGGMSSVNYTIVDMNLPGNAGNPGQPNLGEVVVASKNVAFINQSAEGMIVVEQGTAGQYWLIVYNQITFDISAYDIQPGGNIVTIPARTFNVASAPLAANLSYSPAAGKIAVSPQDANKNVVILNFDNNTGTFTFDQTINNSGVDDLIGQAIYDTEWSPDGTKLYISRHGNLPAPGSTGDLYQFDFNNPGNTFVSLANGPIYRSYGLKMGPDDRIYHLYQTGQFDPIRLGRINVPNQIVDSIDYEINVLNGTGFTSRQFPEFAPPEELILNAVSFEYLDSCLNSTTKFFPEFDDEPQPDNFVWDFGGGGAGQENYIAPIVTYEQPGTYNVSLTISAGGDTEVFNDVVEVFQNDLMINLGNDTTICPGESLTLDPQPQGQQGTLTYGWSTEETTPTITVDSAGTYWVVVTDQATGCDTYDAITITVYGNEEQTGNFWYFGNNAGIDFNENPPVALNDGAQNAPEGTATVSDANGDLLFYTDGETVYNRDHAVMPGGTDINRGGTNGSTQSAIIIQFPGDETMYYIFTTDAVFGDGTYNMRYSVVDLKEDAPFGKVTVKGKPLFVRSTEKLTATMGGDITWVLGHEFGNNTFRAYPIDTLGIPQPVLSAVGSVHNNSIENNGRGYMKLTQDNNNLAVTIPGNPNIVEIFDFDTNSGEVSNPYQIDLMENSGFVYGLEWSPGGNKLYVSVNLGNGNSVLKEYAFDSLRTEAALINEENVNESLGAIQFAPDNQIYVAIDGSTTLGRISVNEDSAQISTFDPAGFNLAPGTTSTLGLPNFMQSQIPPTQDPSLDFTEACVGQETSFTGTGTSDIDEFFWSFGDGNQSNEQNPVHTYQAAGTYNVALRITNRCGFDSTLNATVEVFAPPQGLGSRAEAICDNDLQLVATNDTSPGLTFDWTSSNGQVFSDRLITIQDPGEYIVTITNANGCSESDTINVVDGRPATNLGPDRTVCQNETVNDLDAQNPNATITWFINGVDQNNPTRLQAVDTSVDGVFQYVVFVEDALTNCIRRDTVNITVNPQPDIAVVENNATCGNNDGSIDLTLNDTGDFSYNLTGPNPSNGPLVNGVNPIPGLGAGTYNLTVTNNLSGCTVTQNNITIVDAPSTFQITGVVPGNPADFCDDNGSAEITLDTDVFPVTWQVFDENGVNITANLTGSGGPPGGPTPNNGANGFTITGLGDGTYTFEITGAGGCLQTIDETFNTAQIVFNIAGPLDGCVGDPTLWQVQDINGNPFVNPNFEVEWSTNTGSFTSGGQSQIGATVGINQIGTHRYYVTVRDLVGGACDTTDSIDVTIQNPPVITFSTNGDICDGQVQLSANVQNALPGEVFSYDWSSTSFPDVQTINVGPSVDPVMHLVRVGSNLRTCIASADTTFKVNEPIEIILTPEQACDDGQPVTITAEVVQTNVTYTWAFNGGALGFTTPEIEAVDEGRYTVTVSNADCSSEESVDLIRAPFTQGDLPSEAIICPADPNPDVNSVLLDPGSGFMSYEWVFNGSTTTTPTFLATQEGIIEVSLTNSFNCTDRRRVDILEDCVPRLSAPNAFSPNGNDQNETFSVFTNFVTEFEIFIYNRWGELVFHSTDKDFQWDGSFGGKPAPIGTYAYVIRFKSEYDRTNRTLEQRGGVTLLR